ncbi:MAG TPA: FG-GAP-like repeat-containing protein [Bryobacteraceae bacterium]|nr:FG-GAP-like repeat-containing protein [Bryobacteraceae bacterium]
MRKTLLIACLAIGVAQTGPSKDEALWHLRNLGKAFYENPTTQVEAVAEFKKALDLDPGSARERLNYGLSLLRAGKTKEGVEELKKVQKQDPKLPHTWFNLGIVYRKDGDVENATRQFEEMVKLVPEEPVSHYNLGVLYKQAGRMADAEKQFEIAEKINPNLAAPHFQLYNVYRQAGKREQQMAQLATFQRLKKEQEGAAVPEDMEWCDYAEIYDPIESLPENIEPAPVKFDDVALVQAKDPKSAGVTLIDAFGTGHSDVIAWADGKAALYKQGVTLVKDSGLADLSGVISIAAGDYDNDGLADLVVLTGQGPKLLHNAKGKFVAQTAALPKGRFEKAVWVDFDHDYDLDLLLLGSRPVLLRNQGTAGFVDRTADFPFQPGEAIDAVPFRLMKDSKAIDVVVSYADHPGVIYRDDLAGHYSAEPVAALPAGARGLRVSDVNHDGWLDVVFHSGGILNREGKFVAGQGSDALMSVEADFDGDGRGDSASVAGSGAVVTRLNRSEGKSRWLSVQLAGIKNIKLAYQSEVEVKTGRLYTKKVYMGTPLHFDLRGYAAADTVRITWANGLVQNETKQAADKAYSYKEAQRLSGSCPMIWIWNGSEFEFVTDVLGVAPLGAMSGDGEFFPTNHREYIQLPKNALKAVNGRYEVRITEELSEVSYLDQVELLAVDHPAGMDIYTNEKWKSPPFPEFRLFGVTRRVNPVSAREDGGKDVTAEVLKIDKRYPNGFPHNLIGVAGMHSLTLDFGKNAARDNKSVLVLNGWVDWADGSTFLSAAQEGKGGLLPPYLQVKDRDGQWKTVIEDMGMPSGKPKTIAVDLSGKFLSASREVRIVTNMCVYWDEIFLSDGASAPDAQMHRLAAAAADVRFRGFSDSKIDPLRLQPETFFYQPAKTLSYWNPTPGLYTRYGDVTELVRRPDDQFVIMGSGDELRLHYPASEPPLRPGWTRDFILKVEGWAKDRDANTAYSQSVKPLPFHAMSRYPYPPDERYPDDAAHRAYEKKYNTRPALLLLRPLNEELSRGRAEANFGGEGTR